MCKSGLLAVFTIRIHNRAHLDSRRGILQQKGLKNIAFTVKVMKWIGTRLTLDTVRLDIPPVLWADLLVLDQVVADGHAAMRVGLHEGDGRQALGNGWETHRVWIWRYIWEDRIMTRFKHAQHLNYFALSWTTSLVSEFLKMNPASIALPIKHLHYCIQCNARINSICLVISIIFIGVVYYWMWRVPSVSTVKCTHMLVHAAINPFYLCINSWANTSFTADLKALLFCFLRRLRK